MLPILISPKLIFSHLAIPFFPTLASMKTGPSFQTESCFVIDILKLSAYPFPLDRGSEVEPSISSQHTSSNSAGPSVLKFMCRT